MLCYALSLSWPLCFLCEPFKNIKDMWGVILSLYEWVNKFFSEVRRESVSTWWRRGKMMKKRSMRTFFATLQFSQRAGLGIMFVWMALSDFGHIQQTVPGGLVVGMDESKRQILHDIAVNPSITHIYRTSTASGKVLCWVTNINPPKFITLLKDRIHVAKDT